MTHVRFRQNSGDERRSEIQLDPEIENGTF